MTDKQKGLIMAMNEFCAEKCPLTASVKEASKYIDQNIDEYLRETADWSGLND